MFPNLPNIMDLSMFNLIIFRFPLNLLCITLLIGGIYVQRHSKKEYIFSLYLFNLLIFFVASLLSAANLGTGFAFGLFAVFSILRYRTIQLPVKEMTYLFISIILAILNSTVTSHVSLLVIIFSDLMIIGSCYLIGKLFKGHWESRIISYEKIELTLPNNKAALIQDLVERTGLDIKHIKILSQDFLKDSTEIQIFYKPQKDVPITR